MANTKIEQLKSKASTIKNEVEEGRNTANRIGGAFSDVAEILDSQDQDLESQKEELSDSKKKISLVARGTIESSKIDTLNSMVSEGLYVLTGQATNMSHLLVTSASNGWIYQYLFGPFNASASGVPATDGGASQNTIGVRFYNKTSWSEWKYVDLSYLSGIKEVISGIQTAISSIELTTEKVMEGGKSQKSINEETAASLNDLALKTDDVKRKTENIENETTEETVSEVDFYNDDKTERLHHIGEDGADFKNLTTGGKPVATKDDIENLPAKDDVDKSETSDDCEMSAWASNDYDDGKTGELYGYKDKSGIHTIGYFFMSKDKKECNLLDSVNVRYTYDYTFEDNKAVTNLTTEFQKHNGKRIIVKLSTKEKKGKYQVIVDYGLPTRKTFIDYIDEYMVIDVPTEFTSVNVQILNSAQTNVRFQIIDSFVPATKLIYVGAGCEFTSILNAVRYATQFDGAKIIVEDGLYDIAEEFKAVYGISYFNNYENADITGIQLKHHVHLCFSPGAKVVFDGSFGNSTFVNGFGPFHSAALGFTIEGLNIESKNCRYSVHDERNSEVDFYHNVYKNCTMSHDNTTVGNYHQCIGGGLGARGLIEVQGCVFTSKAAENVDTPVVSWHNSAHADAKSKILVCDNYIANKGHFRFGDHGTSLNMTEIIVCGNSFGTDIKHVRETSSDTVTNGIIYSFNNEIRL